MSMIWTKKHGKLFIDRLREITGERELNQEDLAEKLGISGKTLSQWVNGHTPPKLEFLLTICKDYQCSLDYLIGVNDIYSMEMSLSDAVKNLIDLDNVMDLHMEITDIQDGNPSHESRVNMSIIPKAKNDYKTRTVIKALHEYIEMVLKPNVPETRKQKALESIYSDMDKDIIDTQSDVIRANVFYALKHSGKARQLDPRNDADAKQMQKDFNMSDETIQALKGS